MAEKQDVVFKGTKDGLYLVFNDSQEFEVLREKLKEHLKRAEFFFQGKDVTLDTGKSALSLDEILEIQNILAYPYGLKLKKIVHRGQLPISRTHDDTDRDGKKVGDLLPQSGQGGLGRASGREASATAPGIGAGAPENPGERPPRATRRAYEELVASLPETLLYKGTLRSGQRVDYTGNVVVLGDVNPGAEIKATGDIVVFGALRGLAHAGAEDGLGAVVAWKFEPVQLRIGDVIGRPPEGRDVAAQEPEVARLKDGAIVIEPLEGTRWEGER